MAKGKSPKLLKAKPSALQQLKGQTRVEAALDRVLTLAMGLKRSSELAEIVGVFQQELNKLKFNLDNCVVWIIDGVTPSANVWLAPVGKNKISAPALFEFLDLPYFKQLLNAWKKRKSIWVYELKGQEKKKLDHQLITKTDLIHLPDNVKKKLVATDHAFVSISFYNYGGLHVSTPDPLSKEQLNILNRFSKAFDLCYTRLRDLEKSEAAAREAQIQLSLERVRAAAMAMHKSTDVTQVMTVLGEQLKHLGFRVDSCNFNTVGWEGDWYLWLYSGGYVYPEQVHVPEFDHPFFRISKEFHSRKNEPGFNFAALTFTKEEKDKFLDHLYSNTIARDIVPEERKKSNYDARGFVWSVAFSKNTSITLANYDTVPFTEEQNQIIRRFGNAFEQSYTRFLDLQKAEAQAREAQIETALEKVRSRSLAMHKSHELQEVIHVVFEKLHELGIEMDSASIIVNRENPRDIDFWIATSDQVYTTSVFLPYIDFSVSRDLTEARDRGNDFFAKQYSFEEKNKWWEWAFEHTGFKAIPKDRKKFILQSQHFSISAATTKNTGILITNYNEKIISGEKAEVLKRLARVFEQSYTRFRDLQKAEAQAREAQVESSLERVRSKTMAMHKSEQLAEVAIVLFEQFNLLGKIPDRISIGTINEETEMFEMWVTDQSGSQLDHKFYASIHEHTSMAKLYAAWKAVKDALVIELTGKDLEDWLRYVREELKLKVDDSNFKGKRVHQAAFFSKGFLLFSTNEVVEDGVVQLLTRFARVFNQTYTRFLDLQKAEAQAREAHIEASLERVRAKAMAMHSTADLTATVVTIFIELRNLGINPLRFGLGIIERDTRNAALYSASISNDGGNLQLLGSVVLDDHPVLKKIYEGWVARSEGYFPVLKGDMLKTYYEKLRPGFKTPEWHADYEQYGQFYYFEEGSLYAWSEKPIAQSEIPIFKRFTSVLALTYKRYNELQLSEANAREAVRRSSIDRVRAEIASMRTTGDLERITPLIWNELTKLGVPFIRCGVFIMDNHAEIIHTFLSTPDGKAIGAFNLPYTTPGNIQFALSHWKKNEIYIDHWTEEVFRQFADTLVKQGAMASPDQYLSTIPHGGFYLHFLPFPQGMLYVGNTDELQNDHLQLIQAVTDAFSAAYTRYEDFSKLEAAKQQVDKTLADLKVTQNQLVQAEKMASLGELTAGIAHEIQNPLNFVNNFSEVSNELIDEMVEEVNKGNFDEAKAILLDVKKNLDKINHHGKRADGIVKNMLQHSQSGSSQKELTDINQLCDEYVRLSYHGLRAKDKSFNAKVETYFDPNLEKINVIPQEIGRVVLNLVNNAFYAANEKKNNNTSGFEPRISITTKKQNARPDDLVGRGKIEIIVSDNGTGIPQKVLDKIFQPFFTTKPTGQGTGLGLSLSYDIVKVHGGELKVETKEGEGSKFEVHLPV